MCPYDRTISGPRIAYGETESEDGNYALRMLTVSRWMLYHWYQWRVQRVVDPSREDTVPRNERASYVNVRSGVAIAPGEEALGKLLEDATCGSGQAAPW